MVASDIRLEKKRQKLVKEVAREENMPESELEMKMDRTGVKR